MKNKIKFSLNPVFFASAAFFLSGELCRNYLYAVLFAFFHEISHLVAMLAFGVLPDRISFEAQGIRIDKNNLSLSYRQECVLALSGPFVNLIFMLSAEKTSLIYVVNSGLFFINLLPLKSLDGGRFLYCLVALCKDESAAQRTVFISELVTLFLLSAFLLFLHMSGIFNVSVSVFAVLIIIVILTDLFSSGG